MFLKVLGKKIVFRVFLFLMLYVMVLMRIKVVTATHLSKFFD